MYPTVIASYFYHERSLPHSHAAVLVTIGRFTETCIVVFLRIPFFLTGPHQTLVLQIPHHTGNITLSAVEITMSRSRRYTQNLSANWGFLAANILVMFFLSPFVVRTLGNVEYGIWSLLNVFTAYLGVLDLGLRASVGRQTILHLARKEHEAVDRTIRTALGFFSVLGAIIPIVRAIPWSTVSHDLFIHPRQLSGSDNRSFPFLAVSIWLSMLQSVFSGLLIAHERFDLTRGVDFAVLVGRSTLAVVVLSTGCGVAGLAAVTVGAQLFALGANYILAKRTYPRLTIWPFTVARKQFARLFRTESPHS